MVLLYVLFAVVLINCSYYLLFSKFSFLPDSDHPTQKNTTQKYPISLIICAKNEAENLEKNIPFFLEQNHPNFELILINDASSDNTLEVMEAFQKRDARIQIVDVENNETFWANKKYALTLGIKRAQNKRMLFTDADCQPASSNWLAEMTQQLSEEKQLVLGYGAYEKTGGFLNKIIRFETLMTALQYFSYAKAGMPYMGVGRNLAYTSPLYYSANGFTSHIKVASGDDDLFVNEVATEQNTAICFAESAFTYSTSKKTWKSWFLQKRRHIATAKLYKPKHKFLLAFYYVSNLLFWVLATVVLLINEWPLPTILIGFRFLIQCIVVGKATAKLKEKGLVYLLPILELFLILLQMSIFISNSRTKPNRWK